MENFKYFIHNLSITKDVVHFIFNTERTKHVLVDEHKNNKKISGDIKDMT